jgi:hypothetical protein
VQLGDRYTVGCKLGISNIQTRNQRRERERVPRVNTSLGHLSMSVPCVGTSLVHLTYVGHIYLTSGPPLMPRGSTSLVHLTQPMPRGRILFNPVRSPRDTWQALIGPHHRPHQHYCHLAACEWYTTVRGGAKWQHTEKPPQLYMPHGSPLLVQLSWVGPTTTLT